MRYFSIDDLREDDIRRVRERLNEMELQSDIEDLYWLPAPAAMLSPVQQEHTESCGPHVMALEIQENAVQLELLVRARGKMRCECVHYAAPALQQHMIGWLDQLLRDLDIPC